LAKQSLSGDHGNRFHGFSWLFQKSSEIQTCHVFDVLSARQDKKRKSSVSRSRRREKKEKKKAAMAAIAAMVFLVL
jgi:hypothetical protein